MLWCIFTVHVATISLNNIAISASELIQKEPSSVTTKCCFCCAQFCVSLGYTLSYPWLLACPLMFPSVDTLTVELPLLPYDTPLVFLL